MPSRPFSNAQTRPDALVAATIAAAAMVTLAAAEPPFANSVVSYEPGVGVPAGYDNPSAVLGSPTRFVDDFLFPSVVSPFSSAYLPSDICGLGSGGSIVVEFADPVEDHPDNPFGIDLLIFGNAFFIDVAWPNGVVGGLFGDGGRVEVSADGIEFVEIPDLDADGLFPTLGYLDVGPYAEAPGMVPSDFTQPVDPAMAPLLVGLEYEQLLSVYGESGGGAGVDLATVGLASIRFVRVSVGSQRGLTIEIDAFADVASAGSNAGDLDGDGDVDGADLAILLADWGRGGGSDLDGDGTVGGADLTILLANWS